MVSFQCDGCGDVQTKKKLDSHWNRCRAPFTCIDCMTTFHGYDYRSHTSCMTEDQKYQGHLYREKPNKAVKRKSVQVFEPKENNALVSRKPTVEDVVEDIIPPPAPTPPPAVKETSVFDFLVEDESHTTPKITFAEEREEMSIKTGAPSIFSGRAQQTDDYRSKEESRYSQQYEVDGFSYGAEPVYPTPAYLNDSTATLHDFKTPAAKNRAAKDVPESAGHSRSNSNSEKKRKRAHTDDHASDVVMPDVPTTAVKQVAETPGLAHSGLTGGIQRMVTGDLNDRFSYPRSPATSPDPDHRALTKLKPVKNTKDKHQNVDPQSPLKKTRRSKDDDSSGLGISIKGRAGKVMSMINGALNTNNTDGVAPKSMLSRRRASSSENGSVQTQEVRGREGERRERKKHKVTRHNGTSRDNVRMEHKKSSSSRRADDNESPNSSHVRNGKSNASKRIEFVKQHHSASDSDDDRRRPKSMNGDMVVFGAEESLRRKCEEFLEYIDKGQESRGYSMNKVLKRWHKDSDIRREDDRRDEERELWKGLRLKKNDRGEIVVFFT